MADKDSWYRDSAEEPKDIETDKNPFEPQLIGESQDFIARSELFEITKKDEKKR